MGSLRCISRATLDEWDGGGTVSRIPRCPGRRASCSAARRRRRRQGNEFCPPSRLDSSNERRGLCAWAGLPSPPILCASSTHHPRFFNRPNTTRVLSARAHTPTRTPSRSLTNNALRRLQHHTSELPGARRWRAGPALRAASAVWVREDAGDDDRPRCPLPLSPGIGRCEQMMPQTAPSSSEEDISGTGTIETKNKHDVLSVPHTDEAGADSDGESTSRVPQGGLPTRKRISLQRRISTPPPSTSVSRTTHSRSWRSRATYFHISSSTSRSSPTADRSGPQLTPPTSTTAHLVRTVPFVVLDSGYSSAVVLRIGDTRSVAEPGVSGCRDLYACALQSRVFALVGRRRAVAPRLVARLCLRLRAYGHD
uniref:Uncharacterized protein n=1 Tax=Mycena chlorophos TaxID=658473 RepID=A0ABQ0LJF6_MYCCL|nr:predicted protein [Mycena chlorophos]